MKGKIMQNLDALGFKFKVGDIVCHRLGFTPKYDKDTPVKTPILILERQAQECMGGVQLRYLCRLGAATGVSAITFEPRDLFTFTEIELMELESQ